MIVSPGPGAADPPHGDEPATGETPGLPLPGLVDVTGLPLHELIAGERSVFDNAVRRLLDELAGDEEIVAGHSDAVIHQPGPDER